MSCANLLLDFLTLFSTVSALFDLSLPSSVQSGCLRETSVNRRNIVGAYLLWGNRLLRGFVEFFNRFLVVSKIFFATNKDYRESLTEVKDFGNPLFEMTVSASIIQTLLMDDL